MPVRFGCVNLWDHLLVRDRSILAIGSGIAKDAVAGSRSKGSSIHPLKKHTEELRAHIAEANLVDLAGCVIAIEIVTKVW